MDPAQNDKNVNESSPEEKIAKMHALYEEYKRQSAELYKEFLEELAKIRKQDDKKAIASLKNSLNEE